MSLITVVRVVETFDIAKASISNLFDGHLDFEEKSDLWFSCFAATLRHLQKSHWPNFRSEILQKPRCFRLGIRQNSV